VQEVFHWEPQPLALLEQEHWSLVRQQVVHARLLLAKVQALVGEQQEYTSLAGTKTKMSCGNLPLDWSPEWMGCL
jgi:hypothetical protein